MDYSIICTQDGPAFAVVCRVLEPIRWQVSVADQFNRDFRAAELLRLELPVENESPCDTTVAVRRQIDDARAAESCVAQHSAHTAAADRRIRLTVRRHVFVRQHLQVVII